MVLSGLASTWATVVLRIYAVASFHRRLKVHPTETKGGGTQPTNIIKTGTQHEEQKANNKNRRGTRRDAQHKEKEETKT